MHFFESVEEGGVCCPLCIVSTSLWYKPTIAAMLFFMSSCRAAAANPTIEINEKRADVQRLVQLTKREKERANGSRHLTLAVFAPL